MTQESLFTQILEQICQTAKKQGNYITQEQAEQAFAPLSLGREQFELVYDYLKAHKIGINEPVNLDDYLSGEEIDYLKDYVNQINAFPNPSTGEREAITLSAMAGDVDAQNRLVQVFLPQVVEIAKLYAGQGIFLEDLIGEGNVALTIGVTMLGAFEHAGEAEGMLAKMIMDAMEAFIAENAEAVQKDRRLADQVNRVADKANELADDLKRKVTIEELMSETGMSRKAIEDAIRISGDKIEAILSAADGGVR
ncbi:MAG: hypothetical protein K2P65_06405 [Lachnospiraceae bacterium]|nr:hypothetical protein [Lachnospiraceae bacterium]